MTLSLHPHFDDDTKLMFSELISKSKCYLEYGSGGSTLYSLKKSNVSHVYSVESDAVFTNTLLNVLTEGERSRLSLVAIDLGETGPWGFPVDESGAHSYWSYPSSVWEMIARLDNYPDLILIDGRFRVACFLISLLHAREDTVIIFDDFYDRDHYEIVQKYLDVTERAGRSAIFRTGTPLRPDAEYISQLLKYVLDPR